MTEDEAKTKWCPMVQVTAAQHFNDVEYGDNRGNGDEDHNCIASNCMMWRWDELFRTQKEKDNGIKLYGYCGLTK